MEGGLDPETVPGTLLAALRRSAHDGANFCASDTGQPWAASIACVLLVLAADGSIVARISLSSARGIFLRAC